MSTSSLPSVSLLSTLNPSLVCIRRSVVACSSARVSAAGSTLAPFTWSLKASTTPVSPSRNCSASAIPALRRRCTNARSLTAHVWRMDVSFSTAASRSMSMDRSSARSDARVVICAASSSRRKAASTSAAADLVRGWGPTGRRETSGHSRLRRTTICPASPSFACSTLQSAAWMGFPLHPRRRERKRSPMRFTSPRCLPLVALTRAKSAARATSSTSKYRSPAAGDRSVAHPPRMSTTTLPTRPPTSVEPRTSAYSGPVLLGPVVESLSPSRPHRPSPPPGTTVRFRGASAEHSTTTSRSRMSLTYRPGGR